jgi:NitT/TauT family transport system substrate-binding protein
MSFKSLRLLAAVAASMALLSALPASAAEKVSLRLKWLAQAQFAGFYVAKAKGFYDQAGLDLTINPGGPNLNVETLVASGNDTFGLAGGTETVLLAREKGLPLVCIGVTVQKTPFTYVTYKDSGITKVQDFAGKKVATWFTGTQYTLYSMLAAGGVKQSDLTIVPQSGSMAPFVEKQFDVAAATYYNELNTLKEQGLGDKLTLIKPDDYGVVVQQDTVLVSEKYRNEKPQQVQAFMNATVKGLEVRAAEQEGGHRHHHGRLAEPEPTAPGSHARRVREAGEGRQGRHRRHPGHRPAGRRQDAAAARGLQGAEGAGRPVQGLRRELLDAGAGRRQEVLSRIATP